MCMYDYVNVSCALSLVVGMYHAKQQLSFCENASDLNIGHHLSLVLVMYHIVG